MLASSGYKLGGEEEKRGAGSAPRAARYRGPQQGASGPAAAARLLSMRRPGCRPRGGAAWGRPAGVGSFLGFMGGASLLLPQLLHGAADAGACMGGRGEQAMATLVHRQTAAHWHGQTAGGRRQAARSQQQGRSTTGMAGRMPRTNVATQPHQAQGRTCQGKLGEAHSRQRAQRQHTAPRRHLRAAEQPGQQGCAWCPSSAADAQAATAPGGLIGSPAAPPAVPPVHGSRHPATWMTRGM